MQKSVLLIIVISIINYIYKDNSIILVLKKVKRFEGSDKNELGLQWYADDTGSRIF